MSFIDILDETLNENVLICIMEFLECTELKKLKFKLLMIFT